MASQWFYRIFGEEFGPSSFQDMAELVRKGTLTEEDSVRRAESRDWVRARDVVGLFRDQAQPSPVVAPQTEQASNPIAAKPEQEQTRSAAGGAGRPWKRAAAATGLLLATGVAIIVIARANTTPLFPEPALRGARRVGGTPASVPPRPANPSIAGLEKAVARPVPGLDEIPPAFAPSLTADLLTIVYCGPGNPGTAHDIYIARRDEPSRPFGKPTIISTCMTSDMETRPALSPDGLQLIFLRSEKQPQPYYARRKSVQDTFGPAVPAVFDDLETAGRRMGLLQFVGRDTIALSVVTLAPRNRSVYLLRCGGQEPVFGSLEELPVFNPWNMYYAVENTLRTYFGTAEGIFVSARNDSDQTFSPGERLLDSEVTGPIDGPIWVAPQEDVIVYCSPGPGKAVGDGRRLWMVSF